MSVIKIPEGQRKLTALVVTGILATLAEYYFPGGLSDNLAVLLGSGLAFFIGGNALEYKTKIQHIPMDEEVIESEEDPKQDPNQLTLDKVADHVMRLDNACGKVLKEHSESIAGINQRLEQQTQSISDLVKLLNKRGANEQA